MKQTKTIERTKKAFIIGLKSIVKAIFLYKLIDYTLN